MKPAAQIQASIELMDEVLKTGSPADRIMANYFRSHRYIGSKDKAAISEHLYTVLRNRLSYEYLLDQVDIDVSSRGLVAVMLLQQEKTVTDYFNGDTYSPPRFSSAALEKLASIEITALDTAPVNVKLNVPAWIEPKLIDALGERYEDEMRASNLRAATDIRTNTIKGDRAALKEVLADEGYETEDSTLSPWGLRFKSRVGLFGLKSFNNGLYEVQDEGSQVLALMSQAKPGDKVYDFCAGAGGKTLALAAMMENKGSVFASDVHTKRLDNLSKRAKRAGAHNIRTHVLSSESDKWVKHQRARADIVLIDAPCSGTGTWRRSPDSRWNLKQENLDNLVELQQRILISSSRLVKPGGRLLYATCSLLKEENEDQVASFLAANSDFFAADIELPETLSLNQQRIDHRANQLRLFPGLSETDGFFLAVLQRRDKI